MNMADREFLDVIAFVPRGQENKRKPQNVGYAFWKDNNGKQELRITMTSLPLGAWDGSLIVQEKREQRDAGAGGYGGGQRTAAPQTGGFAPRTQQSAPRRAEVPPHTDDDYGPAGGMDDDQLPF